MGTLQAALEWARRGFPVFPLHEGRKEPVHDLWQQIATTDETTIKALWRNPVLGTEYNHNIGVLCTNFVVIDIDVKRGKNGYEEYANLGGHYDTLVVQTPTGGIHCYFNGPDSSNSPISDAIDIRSHNGYVLAPGSVLPGYGTETYKVLNDRGMAGIPQTILPLLRSPYERAQIEVNPENLDTPASIEAAIRFLESAPPAIEGQRGDERTFITAARLVREMGLTPQTAFNLLRDVYNPRCSPPWSLEELHAKIVNACNYGSALPGKLTAEALFGGLVIPPPPSLYSATGTSWGNAFLPASMRPRPWIVERMLMREAVTLLMAAGSAGKSSLSLALAAHMALGLDFAGYKYKPGVACKTIVYNGEDDVEEQSRRLLAICMSYGFDFDKVRQNILLLSQKQIRMDLVTNEFRKPIRNDALVNYLVEVASAEDVGLIVVDPLVKIHKCDESDNVQMDFVMETLTDIAQRSNVSVLALHHTSKGGKNEDRSGNMDISRGASAIVNAARIAYTLLNASLKDAEDFGMQEHERNMWVRMDDAKMNLALSSNQATWFKKESVRIPSLDMVGVLKHEAIDKNKEHIVNRVGRLLISNMQANGAASMTMQGVVNLLKSQEPVWANRTDQDVKKRVEGMFCTPIEMEGGTLHVQRKMDEKGQKETVTLVLL